MVRVLDSGLARLFTRDISSAATTMGLGVVLMGSTRMIGAVGVTGAFEVRYLGRAKVCDATPATGVPRKMTHNKHRRVRWSNSLKKKKKKRRTPPPGADGQHVRTRPIPR